MKRDLPPFTIFTEEDTQWFVLLEGELTGVMFRLIPNDSDFTSIAYDIATNQYFEGGEERLTKLYGEIESVVEKFINFAIKDVAAKIESGELTPPNLEV
jgi:hypothetical protein